MRIVIIGAGALGGLVGAELSLSGEDVTFVEINEARVKLINEGGLFVSEGAKGERCVPVKVQTTIAGLPVADLLFISVKTYQTDGALRSALPVIGPETFVLSMQNGIGNTDIMAGIIPEKQILSGITYHSIQHTGPNRIRYRKGIKPIQIAPYDGNITPAIKEVGEVFNRAGLETNVAENIDNVIWQKLLHNAAVNPISALTGLTCRELLDDEDCQNFQRELAYEIVEVMRARGVPIVDEEDPYRPVINSQKALGKNRPSMWQDLSRGCRTEVDAINGAVVAEAKKHGMQAPLNWGLCRFIHSRERQTFLRQEEVAETLRAAEATAGTERGKVPAGRRTARPTLLAPGGGMPTSSEPLKTAPLLKGLLQKYYQDVQAAADDPDRKIAYCSGTGPAEIVRAMGLTPYFPENQAALIGAGRQSGDYISRALQEGFSQFASSAMASDIGAMLAGDSPLVTVYGIDGPPDPDVVVYSTNFGHERIRWFEYYGRRFSVPTFGLHPPSVLGDINEIEIGVAHRQLERLIEDMEKTSGCRLDHDRLAEIVSLTGRATKLWGEILNLCRNEPAPLTYFDTLIHLAPIIVMRGTVEAVEYYTLLKAEVEERIANGIAAVPGERFRFYWEGPPIWPALRPISDLFQKNRVAVVASTYCNISAMTGLDPENPVESLAKAYTSIFPNRSDAWKDEFLMKAFKDFAVDGVIYHEGRTAPEQSNVRYGLEVRLRRAAAIHALVIEADTHDLRLFSMDQIMRKLRDFIEIHELNAGVSG